MKFNNFEKKDSEKLSGPNIKSPFKENKRATPDETPLHDNHGVDHDEDEVADPTRNWVHPDDIADSSAHDAIINHAEKSLAGGSHDDAETFDEVEIGEDESNGEVQVTEYANRPKYSTHARTPDSGMQTSKEIESMIRNGYGDRSPKDNFKTMPEGKIQKYSRSSIGKFIEKLQNSKKLKKNK